eukprot:GCRY01002156.1.p1 GENE.GCRY01002156.1~~GCRY01002156.1.p1  ORF type:complete len:114 (-),score=11.68 GCRY01002156.1:968-1309(-)
MGILRVVIGDTKTGTSLLDKVWRWKGEPNREGVSKLMQVFFQFSREMDTGVINQVMFDEPEDVSRARPTGLGTLRRRPPTWSQVQQNRSAVGMMLQRSPRVMVAVFHDQNTEV